MSSPFQQQFSAKSPLNQDRKIIGEDTYNLVKDENSGNFVAGLGAEFESADPGDFTGFHGITTKGTSDRLVITPKQKKNMGENVSKFEGEEWIEQYYPMTVVKDSVSGGKTYYGLKKPSKK